MTARLLRAGPLDVPARFDRLALTEFEYTTSGGRTLRYVDTGPADGIPLVIFTGGGTSVRALELLEFTATVRRRLGVRLLGVERNGLGGTVFDDSATIESFAGDVWELLDTLGISTPSVGGISGGGPYAAQIVATRAESVRSLHLACAVTDLGLDVPAQWLALAENDPVSWWTYGPHSPVHRIPGFAQAVVDEATRARFTQGSMIPALGLQREFDVLSQWHCPDLTALTAPVFLLWGADDPVVPLVHAHRWQETLPATARLVVHAGEEHDVQYRHWDQVLVDVASLGALVVVADPTDSATSLVLTEDAAAAVEAGAILGCAAWLPGSSEAEPGDGRVHTPYEGMPGRPWDPDVIEAPLQLHQAIVPTAWVDYNDHMSESCFLLAFGDNADAFFRYLGVNEAYREAGHSLFSVETHIVHTGEAGLGDRVTLTLHVLGADAKRVHIMHVMTNADTGALLATGEQMLLHVDLNGGGVVPMPADLQERLRAIVSAHAGLPTPVAAGRAIRAVSTA